MSLSQVDLLSKNEGEKTWQELTRFLPSWWFSPTPSEKICAFVKLDHETPSFGVTLKHVWNHHLVTKGMFQERYNYNTPISHTRSAIPSLANGMKGIPAYGLLVKVLGVCFQGVRKLPQTCSWNVHGNLHPLKATPKKKEDLNWWLGNQPLCFCFLLRRPLLFSGSISGSSV